MSRELMNRKFYPYYGSVQKKGFVVSKSVVLWGLAAIGGLAVTAKAIGMTFGILGLGLGLLMYPIAHPINSLIFSVVLYGVWRCIKR